MRAVSGRRGRQIASAVAILLTAFALQRACTPPWGRATGVDGTPYEFSAVGLSRLARSPTDPRVDCRWWPRYGDPVLCAVAPDRDDAALDLRRVYPMLQVALWLAVASVLLQALRVPRQRVLQVAMPFGVFVLTGLALRYLSSGVRTGLAALSGATVDRSLQGYWGALIALALSALATILLAESFSAGRDDERERHEQQPSSGTP